MELNFGLLYLFLAPTREIQRNCLKYERNSNESALALTPAGGRVRVGLCSP